MENASNPGPEAELLRRWFVDRDPAALDRILADNMEFVRNHASRNLREGLRTKEETADVVQDAIMDFFRYAPSFPITTTAQLRGLLRTIVDGVLAGHHRYFQRLRRQSSKEQVLATDTTTGGVPVEARDPSPSAVARGDELDGTLRLAIATLEPLDQRIVAMRVYDQLEFRAIGEAVGMKVDSVRVRCKRALVRVSNKVAAAARGDMNEFFA